jgi:hypothetical protein
MRVMSLTPQALLAELDTALPQASESWRNAVLRQIADLFLNSAELYSSTSQGKCCQVSPLEGLSIGLCLPLCLA